MLMDEKFQRALRYSKISKEGDTKRNLQYMSTAARKQNQELHKEKCQMWLSVRLPFIWTQTIHTEATPSNPYLIVKHKLER
jgi:hypothetical protein